MSDSEDIEAAAEPPKRKPKLLVLVAIAVGALVVLGGGGTAAVLLLGHKKPAPEPEAAHAAPAEVQGEKPVSDEQNALEAVAAAREAAEGELTPARDSAPAQPPAAPAPAAGRAPAPHH